MAPISLAIFSNLGSVHESIVQKGGQRTPSFGDLNPVERSHWLWARPAMMPSQAACWSIHQAIWLQFIHVTNGRPTTSWSWSYANSNLITAFPQTAVQ